MNKIYDIFKPMIYAYTFQYLPLVIIVFIYFILGNDISFLNSDDFISKYMIIGLIVTSIPVIIYMLKKFYIKENKIKGNKLLLSILLGLSISLFYNMVIFKFNFISRIDLSNIFYLIYIIIITPIYEEIVYRYITLRKAKEYYSKEKAVLIVTLVFSLMHSGLFNILYAFIIGLILSYVYDKYNNIIYSIILHVFANVMSIFIVKYSFVALVISFISLALIMLYLRDE